MEHNLTDFLSLYFIVTLAMAIIKFISTEGGEHNDSHRSPANNSCSCRFTCPWLEQFKKNMTRRLPIKYETYKDAKEPRRSVRHGITQVAQENSGAEKSRTSNPAKRGKPRQATTAR